MLDPRPYQRVGADFLAGRRHALLADQMRVGKTGQAILAAVKLDLRTVLVLCPAIAVDDWIAAWRDWAGWEASRLGRGDVELRDRTIVVGSFDTARNRQAELMRTRWGALIVDEAHFCRNPQAQRTRMVYAKEGIGWCSDRIWALSGTPAVKHAAELWPMMRAFGVTRLGYNEFVYMFCKVDDLGRPIGTKYPEEVKKLLARFMLRRTRADVAPELPEIGFNHVYIEGDGGVFENAPQGDDLIDWIERNAASDADVRIKTALAKAPALAARAAEGFKSGDLERTVVFGHHREPLEAVRAMLVEQGLRVGLLTGATMPKARAELRRLFDAGELQVLVANILAAGTAIDLSAARHGFFLELDWVPANNIQAANRLVSLAKPDPVTFDVLTWRGSDDERINRALTRRAGDLRAMGIS